MISLIDLDGVQPCLICSAGLPGQGRKNASWRIGMFALGRRQISFMGPKTNHRAHCVQKIGTLIRAGESDEPEAIQIVQAPACKIRQRRNQNRLGNGSTLLRYLFEEEIGEHVESASPTAQRSWAK